MNVSFDLYAMGWLLMAEGALREEGEPFYKVEELLPVFNQDAYRNTGLFPVMQLHQSQIVIIQFSRRTTTTTIIKENKLED